MPKINASKNTGNKTKSTVSSQQRLLKADKHRSHTNQTDKTTARTQNVAVNKLRSHPEKREKSRDVSEQSEDTCSEFEVLDLTIESDSDENGSVESHIKTSSQKPVDTVNVSETTKSSRKYKSSSHLKAEGQDVSSKILQESRYHTSVDGGGDGLYGEHSQTFDSKDRTWESARSSKEPEVGQHPGDARGGKELKEEETCKTLSKKVVDSDLDNENKVDESRKEESQKVSAETAKSENLTKKTKKTKLSLKKSSETLKYSKEVRITLYRQVHSSF